MRPREQSEAHGDACDTSGGVSRAGGSPSATGGGSIAFGLARFNVPKISAMRAGGAGHGRARLDAVIGRRAAGAARRPTVPTGPGGATLPSRLTMTRSGRALAAAVLSLAVLSCSKKNDSGTTAPPGSSTATISGLVASLSGAGLPLAGATVTSDPASGAPVTTNGLGEFTLTIPANTPVTVTASKQGYTLHSFRLQLAGGESRGLSLSLLPFGVTQIVTTSVGGKAVDPTTKAAVTLPPNFVTSVGAARVAVTGLDPTTGQALGMPGG